MINETLLSGLMNSAMIAAFLPAILMFIINQSWSKDAKKLVAAGTCFLVTVLVAWQNNQLFLDVHNMKLFLSNLIVLITISNQLYDKFWQPLANKIADNTPLKFIRRSSSSNTNGDG